MITFQKYNYLVHYNSDGSGDALIVALKPGSSQIEVEINEQLRDN